MSAAQREVVTDLKAQQPVFNASQEILKTMGQIEQMEAEKQEYESALYTRWMCASFAALADDPKPATAGEWHVLTSQIAFVIGQKVVEQRKKNPDQSDRTIRSHVINELITGIVGHFPKPLSLAQKSSYRYKILAAIRNSVLLDKDEVIEITNMGTNTEKRVAKPSDPLSQTTTASKRAGA